MQQQVYRLVVEGELGPRYASAFDGMTIRVRGGRTEITGPVVDQSRMQSLLERVGSLGLTLCSVTVVEEADHGVAAAADSRQPLSGVAEDSARD